jgi:hypothetical protein
VLLGPIFWCAGFGRASNAEGRSRMNITGRVVFLAQLTKAPTPAPRCGDIMVAVGHRVDVLSVLEGTLAKGPLTLIVPCPDLKGDGFIAVGARYRVEAASTFKDAGRYTVYNDEKEGPLLWALDIRKA